MSVDALQNKIRKLKNPLMVAFRADFSQIPHQYRLDEKTQLQQCCDYTEDLLAALKDILPAVRFDFGSFAVWGAEGISALMRLMNAAQSQGYYLLLDAPGCWSVRQAELLSEGMMEQGSAWEFDGLLLSCYMGSDVIKPFADRLQDTKKDLFVVLRTGNKSAFEIQDLLAGSRLVHTAAADVVKRLGENHIDHCGYSRIAGVGPAASADILQNLRSKFPTLFLLVDGLDNSGANAKNCANAFDQLGHGAIVCVSDYVIGAWQNTDVIDEDPVSAAVMAAERIKKNLSRYVTIL